MTARQQRRREEHKARKEACKTEKQVQSQASKLPENVASSRVTTEVPRALINKQNAQFSTGPRTEVGKLASSRNSFKHGLYSKQLVIQGEDSAELDALRDDLRREHQPGNTTEEILVNELAEHYWRLRRMRKYEARAMAADNFETGLAILPIIQRTMASAERGFHKSLDTLRRLQKERASQMVPAAPDAKKETGFVPQKQETRTDFLADQPVGTVHPSPENGFVPQNNLQIPSRQLKEQDDSLSLYAEAA